MFVRDKNLLSNKIIFGINYKKLITMNKKTQQSSAKYNGDRDIIDNPTTEFYKICAHLTAQKVYELHFGTYAWTNNVSALANSQKNGLTDNVLVSATSVSIITTPNTPIVFTPEIDLPGFMSRYALTSKSTSTKELFKYGARIITVIALIVAIVSGFLWSTAGGNGQKVSEVKQWSFSDLSGLLLVLFSYLILRTININLITFEPTTIQEERYRECTENTIYNVTNNAFPQYVCKNDYD